MIVEKFVSIAHALEVAGLIWQPEIGDEVAYREQRELISILVDPQGMSPTELRSLFMWLPTVEQLLMQVEARQAILFHAGLEFAGNKVCYKTVIQAPDGPIEVLGESLRLSLGLAVRDLLLLSSVEGAH